MALAEDAIREKYGNTGIMVFGLIDGQRNAQEIMRDTGITEKLLTEILGFMEEKGLIKMTYPDFRQSKINFSLPRDLQEKMCRHNVNWDYVIPKLISLYIDSIEKAEANIELLKLLNIKHKKRKILRKKTALKVRKTKKALGFRIKKRVDDKAKAGNKARKK